MAHGNHFLQIIRHLSQGLNLSLDGEAPVETAVTKKVYPVPNHHQRKLTPAKFEAWRMWHEDGLSIQKIAVRFSILTMLHLSWCYVWVLTRLTLIIEFPW